MAFSYSFHLSSKSHAVSTTGKVGQVSKHNLREYKSGSYDKSKIEVLEGSRTSVLDSVKEIYQNEFSEPLRAYNEGKRADRQISDYLEHVSDSRSDVACEIIIQVGDKDFWSNTPKENWSQMSYIFKDQLRSLKQLVPEFKVASAVVHYDESSPHMHVVGVPVADGYKKGLEKQVAKTKVFTSERLSFLQDEMRKRAERGMELDINKNIFGGVELKAKQKGRNKDIPKQSLDEYYALMQKTDELNLEVEEFKMLKTAEKTSLQDLEKQIDFKKSSLDYFNAQIDMAKEELSAIQKVLGSLKSIKDSVVQIIRDIKAAGNVKGGIERFRECVEKKDRIRVSESDDGTYYTDKVKFESVHYVDQTVYKPLTVDENEIKWDGGTPLYEYQSFRMRPYAVQLSNGELKSAYGDDYVYWQALTPATRVLLPEETEELFDTMDLSEELAERVKNYKELLTQINKAESIEKEYIVKHRGLSL